MFYLGLDAGLCIGPIDEVLDIQFEDRSVDANAQVTIVDGRNGIVFANTPLGSGDWLTAFVPPGSYPNNAAAGLAASDAMTALDGGTWKVCYGYHMLPSFSSQIVYSVIFDSLATDIEIDVTGVYLTGKDAANALVIALNGAERLQSGGARVTWSGDYDERTGLFHLNFAEARAGVTGAYIRGIVDYGISALANYGIHFGYDHLSSGSSGSFVSDYETRAENFVFAFGGTGGKIDLGNPAFTSMSVWGLAVPVSTTGWGGAGDGETLLPVMASGARPSPSFLILTDLGDTIRAVINAPDLFGGLDADGGVAGTIDICKGTTDQLPNDYLEAAVGQDLPAYRGVCHAVFRHTYLGKSPYLKAFSFVLRRCPNQLGLEDGHENISGDANPAAMIFEILTDAVWGLGISTDLIDASTFIAVGDALAAEGIGLSMLRDSQSSGSDLIAEILRYIDGVLFQDPATAKFRLKLARADYTVGDLVVLDVDSIQSCNMSRPSWAQLRNFVRLTYCDRGLNFTDRTVTEIDPAGLQARSGERSIEELQYPAILNRITAQRVAARAMKLLSYPLASLDITVNRHAALLRPGDVFRLTWAPQGIVDMVSRVTGIRLGEPGDDEEAIHVDAMEDIFGVAGTSFTDNPGEWIDPSTLPQPFSAERLVEAPYAIATTRRVMTLASLGSKAVDGYKVWSDPAGGANYAETQDVTQLTPRVQLAQSVGPGDTVLIVGGLDASGLTRTDDPGFAAGKNLVLIDEEWIAWRDVIDNLDGTFTLSHVARGCIDSAPRDHAAGSDVWSITDGYGFTQDDDLSGDGPVAAKFLGYIGADVMAITSALRVSVDVESRALRAYCPCQLSVNRQSYPANIVGDLVLAWIPRDRTDTLTYDDSGATAARETGTHERIRIYGEGDTLIHTEEPVTDPTFIYTVAAEMADTGLDRPSTRLRIVIDTLDGDSLESRDQLEAMVRRGSDVGADTNTEHKVMVSATDTTPDYLSNKLVAGDNITLTVTGSGADEKIEIDADSGGGSSTPMGIVRISATEWRGDSGQSTRGSGEEVLTVYNLQGGFDNNHAAQVRLPLDFNSITAARLVYCNTSTATTTFVVKLGMRIVSDGSDGTAAPTYGTKNIITPVATQDQLKIVSLNLPAVSPGAGDRLQLVLQRPASADTDDVNTDSMALVALENRVRLTKGDQDVDQQCEV